MNCCKKIGRYLNICKLKFFIYSNQFKNMKYIYVEGCIILFDFFVIEYQYYFIEVK